MTALVSRSSISGTPGPSRATANTAFGQLWDLLNERFVAGTASQSEKNETLTALGIINSLVAPGAVLPFAMNTAPAGWLKANGAAVSRTTYAALFAAIGTTFGAGDGSTTFNLPDLRGEFIRGWDDGRGVDSGRVFGSAQADELKSHTHALNIYVTGGGNNGVNGAYSSASFSLMTSGATGGAETRPRNVALLACIKF